MDNDIHLDQQYRKTLKVEEYDGKGSQGGGNHPMSGEPLFLCPKFGLTARSYCYSCTNFAGLKKDKQGNLGECDLYPGARGRIVSQISREQPRELTDALTPKQLQDMGVRNINDDINEKISIGGGTLTPRSVGNDAKVTFDKKEFQKQVYGRNIYKVNKDFGRQVVK